MRSSTLIIYVVAFANISSCHGQGGPNKEKGLSTDGLREYNDIIQETDKSEGNDVWHGSIYRNKKYHLGIKFPGNWEYDKGMSVNTLARALEPQRGITLSVGIQHLPIEVPDSIDIFESISTSDFKRTFSKAFEETNKTIIDELDIKRSTLNNLPAYLVTASYDLTSLDRTMTFIMKQIICLKDSKNYHVTMVLPQDFFDEEAEQIFRSCVDSFHFEFH